ENGQIIKIAEHQDMPGVELGWPPHHAWVIGVGNDVTLVRAVIHALGQRVGNAELEAVGEAAVPRNLQRVVYGMGDVICLPNRAKAQIRPKSVDVLEFGLAIRWINEKVSRIGQCAN